MVNDENFSVLVVDDDLSDLNALYNILKSSYTVYFAKSGEAALKRAADNKPDIILLDVVMPDMNGYDVISELKKVHTLCDIPVIFITGLNEERDELKGFNLGAVDYITKPFHSSIVKARIEAHLKTVIQLRQKNHASIVLKSRKTLRSIKLNDLIYVSVSGHWLNFHLTNGETVLVYASLKDYEHMLLAETQFQRCHNSFLVNMDYIIKVETRDILMKNNDYVPISKRYSDFKKRYEQWIG